MSTKSERDPETRALLTSHRGVQPSAWHETITDAVTPDAIVAEIKDPPAILPLKAPLPPAIARAMPLWAIVPRGTLVENAHCCLRATGLECPAHWITNAMISILCRLYASPDMQATFVEFESAEDAGSDGGDGERLVAMVKVAERIIWVLAIEEGWPMSSMEMNCTAEPALLFLWQCWLLAPTPHWRSLT